MKDLKIVTKGNTVKSLAIQTVDGDKIASGISPKNEAYAKLFCKAKEMRDVLEHLLDYDNTFLVFETKQRLTILKALQND